MRRPFLLSGFIGIFLVAIGLLVNLSGPNPSSELPRGFFSPVIAFEFATENEDINQIFGTMESLDRTELLRTMTNSTRLDFLFLLLYGAFLLSFSIISASHTGARRYYLAALLAIVAPLFDILENLQLLAIMDQIQIGKTHHELELLRLFTWVKWGALAIAFLVFIPIFRSAGTFGRTLSYFAAVPCALGAIAFIKPGLLNELFALSTVLMFICMIIFSFTYRTADI